ncbi:MAG: hypothetical protein EHM19_05620, partial [Candidatus Latescibacterota bacterium]
MISLRITRRLVTLAAVLAAALPIGSMEGRAATAALPNIVLVTLDTTRLDHLGCYGYFRETSPAIDRFAAECVQFDGCLVPISTTLPSHVSLFTATYPAEHGVRGNIAGQGMRFPWDRSRSFTRFLAEAGYRTAAFVSAAPLKRGTGIEEGFDAFDEPAEAERPAGPTTDAALAWLDTIASGPYFLWVHYYDPHYPFQAPAPYAGTFVSDSALDAYIRERLIPDRAPRLFVARQDDSREATNGYDAEVLYMDSEFGRLIDRVRARPDYEETYVLVVGDHGEGLGQHGEGGHGGIWDEQLRVPMLLRAPGEEPRRESRALSLVDALPTLLGRIGNETLSAFAVARSGRDALDPSFREEPVYGEETVVLAGGEPRRYTLTSREWKYLRREGRGPKAGDQLFDLAADPFELLDVAPAHADEVNDLRARLRETIRIQRSRAA